MILQKASGEELAPTATPTTTTLTLTQLLLPYRTSETIRRILAPLGVRTCFRPHRTLRQTLVRLKDRTPLQQRAGVVYRSRVARVPECILAKRAGLWNTA